MTTRAWHLGVLAIASLSVLASCGDGDDGDNGAGEQRQTFDFEVTQNVDTLLAANDLHVTLAGTGGSLRNPSIVQDAPDCSNTPGQPTVASSGNQIDVTWGSPCVDGFETVKLRVETLFPNLQVVSEVWTLDGDTLGR